MRTTSSPLLSTDARQEVHNARTQAMRSILLFFCLLFPMRFMLLFLREGGHALIHLFRGEEIWLLYVHPFNFSGYLRSSEFWDSAWTHASGPVVTTLVPFLIFILLWKRRSLINLPFVMLFPWSAIEAGVNVTGLTTGSGDYYNIIRLTGLPMAIIVIPCILLMAAGISMLFSLFPLLGLDPRNPRALYIIPTAILMWSAVSIAVAYLEMPGSIIDLQYGLAAPIIQSANSLSLRSVLLGFLLGVIYISLYRLAYLKLPRGLRTETAFLSWNDLWFPGLLCVSSLILGLWLFR